MFDESWSYDPGVFELQCRFSKGKSLKSENLNLSKYRESGFEARRKLPVQFHINPHVSSRVLSRPSRSAPPDSTSRPRHQTAGWRAYKAQHAGSSAHSVSTQLLDLRGSMARRVEAEEKSRQDSSRKQIRVLPSLSSGGAGRFPGGPQAPQPAATA